MSILAIDYGEKKVGLAKADSKIASPFKVVRVKSQSEAVEKVVKTVKDEDINLIVVGISEGKQAEITNEFVKKLLKKIKIPLVLQDETLTTYEAQELAKKAGIKRKKRQMLEDAYSAALILQRYLDKD